MSAQAPFHSVKDVIGKENVDGVGEGAVAAMPGTDETGRDEKTPFMALLWTMVAIAGVFAVLSGLVYGISYLVTGHMPF